MKKVFIASFLIIGVFFIFRAYSLADKSSNEIGTIKQDITILKSDVNALKNFNNKLTIYIGIIIALAVFLGFAGFKSLIKGVSSKMRKEINKAIYRVDPTYMEIKVPNSDFDEEFNRLKRLGFGNIKKYNFLDNSCLTGCVIYKIKDDSELDVLKKFFEDKKPDAYKSGFIVYTHKMTRDEFVTRQPNIVCANHVSTLSNAIYTVARNLII